jgi:hypothetical protein
MMTTSATLSEIALSVSVFPITKQCRRVATRYNKLAANYLAFVQLASIRLWLAAHQWVHALVGAFLAANARE